MKTSEELAARVNIGYHIELPGHYYSVLFPLIHECVDARLTANTVEIFHRGQRVATMCRVLGVSPSRHYAWRKRSLSACARADFELTAHIDSRGPTGRATE